MRQRCENPNNASYPLYGGRGITICAAWSDFETFSRDMGPKPSPRHSLDRIDNGKGYSPENCRWATMQQQNVNRRSTVPVGEFDSQRSAARGVGVSKSTIGMRRARGNDPLALGDTRKILTPSAVTEIRAQYGHRVGEYGLSPKLACIYGVAPRTIRHVLNGTRWKS